MGLGKRINEYADREPRRFALFALILLMIPLQLAFLGWFVWALGEFFEETPSYDYFFWLGLIVGAGGSFFVAAAIWDLWKKQIAITR
jgi:hypothetical protein